MQGKVQVIRVYHASPKRPTLSSIRSPTVDGDVSLTPNIVTTLPEDERLGLLREVRSGSISISEAVIKTKELADSLPNSPTTNPRKTKQSARLNSLQMDGSPLKGSASCRSIVPLDADLAVVHGGQWEHAELEMNDQAVVVDYADGSRECLTINDELVITMHGGLHDDDENHEVMRIYRSGRTLFVSGPSQEETARWAEALKTAIAAATERRESVAKPTVVDEEVPSPSTKRPQAPVRGAARGASLPAKSAATKAAGTRRRLLGARQSFCACSRSIKPQRLSLKVPVLPIAGVTALPVKTSETQVSSDSPEKKTAEANSAVVEASENTPIVDSEPKYEPVVEEEADEVVGEMQTDMVAGVTFLERELQALRDLMMERYANGTNQGYHEAYLALASVGIDQSVEASRREFNLLKNRYGNINAYDATRVVLPILGEDPDTDYVNANWVSGFQRERAYIASQAPVPNSMISFWRMIWHCGVESIVMVTNEMENGRIKCHRYWPDPSSSPPVQRMQYGAITVTHLLSEQHRHYILRTFDIEFEGERRTLRQFSYLA